MALINRPIYEHFGARHLGVKGPGALTSLEEGVMGVLPLDVSADPLYWNIQGIKMFMGRVNQAAGGAGTYAKIGLSIEDADAQTLTRILGVWIEEPTSTSNVGIYRCLRSDYSSDPGIYGYGTDTRIPENQHSQSIMINSTDALYPGRSLGRIVADHPPIPSIMMPLVVSPLQAIYFINWNDDEALKLTMTWVEIPAYKAEL
jgi:hypothetical protein